MKRHPRNKPALKQVQSRQDQPRKQDVQRYEEVSVGWGYAAERVGITAGVVDVGFREACFGIGFYFVSWVCVGRWEERDGSDGVDEGC
jgi:hypothetical protein